MTKTIAVPEKIYNRLEERKSTRQPFSGVLEDMLDEVEE